jgi:hypothetical protein
LKVYRGTGAAIATGFAIRRYFSYIYANRPEVVAMQTKNFISKSRKCKVLYINLQAFLILFFATGFAMRRSFFIFLYANRPEVAMQTKNFISKSRKCGSSISKRSLCGRFSQQNTYQTNPEKTTQITSL